MSVSRYFFTLGSVAVLATGCQKDTLEDCPGQCTVVNGRLLTSGQQGLAGATVTVYWQNYYGYIGDQQRTKARAVTDANGTYQLRFYIKDDELLKGNFKLVCAADTQQYYTFQGEGPSLAPKRDTTYQLRPYLIPRKATVLVTVPNASQIPVSGMFLLFQSAHGYQLTLRANASKSGTVYTVYQQPGAATVAATVAADQPVFINTSRLRNGAPVITLDSLVVAAGTTSSLTVPY
ncbi:MAG: hypothetical protein EOO62_14895 [Hymenobacter sp.]|nr:MAG: hypothetical protein EOO62_14895 [Hymenobacter sp.]